MSSEFWSATDRVAASANFQTDVVRLKNKTRLRAHIVTAAATLSET
jgi:hypothetical protein